MPPSNRKRTRENETESQRTKREKAAERQRRKRERDRAQAQALAAEAASQAQAVTTVQAMMAFPPPEHLPFHMQHPPHIIPPPITAAANIPSMAEYHPHAHQPPPPPTPLPPPPAQEASQQPPQAQHPPMTPEEVERREKVRAAARERQRKHRQAVKQRKMRELGLDMDVVTAGPTEELQYRPSDFASDIHTSHLGGLLGDFPGIQALGGQTFASTLLLSFSCAPLLKAHLLRTLNMTNEELASLEPVIAEAWDRWNAQRQLHFAELAKNGMILPLPGHPPFPIDLTGPHHPHDPHAGIPPHHVPPPQLTPHVPPHPPPQASPQSTTSPQPQQVQPPSPPGQAKPLRQAEQQAPSQSPQQSPQVSQHPQRPPPPTFAVANGPSLTPHVPPPPTTAEVNPALDFRNRFSRQINRPVPSTYNGSAFVHDGSPSDGNIDPHLAQDESPKT